MPGRYIDKVGRLVEIRDLPGATGIGSFGSQLYYHDGNNVVSLGAASPGEKWYADADNGASTNTGKGWGDAFDTIAAAISAASAFDTIFIRAKAMSAGATDPSNYAEALTIPAGKSGLSLFGVPGGLAQGRQPQIKIGTGSTAMLTVRSPGCLIHGISFNGGSSTGGGILLDDDASTKSAFGTVVANCFFKNCKGSGNAGTGGAIMWSAEGGAWQIRIQGNHFYSNRGGIVLKGTSGSRPTDVIIEDNTFGSGLNTDIDCDVYLGGGSGAQGVIVRRCDFQTVDVPAYASSPVAARYIDMTGCEGLVSDCNFACVVDPAGTEKTFGAAGTAVFIPAEVRMSNLHGEGVVATADQSIAGRT